MFERSGYFFFFLYVHFFCSVLVFTVCHANAAAPPKRVALVIGNAGYPKSPLSNPIHDTQFLSRQLAEVGFKVLLHNELNQSAMYDAIDTFIAESMQTSEILFFYAGHAIQVNGRNYLIPVNADFKSDDLLSQLFDLRYLTDKLSSLKTARAKIIVLDACRDNPFSKHPLAASGLAEITAPVGTFIAFSTAPGKTAEDGEGDNSPYVTSLIKAMSVPGRKIEEVFKEVRSRVNEETKGRQIPWEATSLEVDFFFSPKLLNLSPLTAAPAKGTKQHGAKSNAIRKKCDAILMKLSLGMEGLSREEQKQLQTECR